LNERSFDMGLIAKAVESHGANDPERSGGLMAVAGAEAPDEDNNKKKHPGGLLSAVEPETVSGLMSAAKGHQ
jgi:hypothetical protein